MFEADIECSNHLKPEVLMEPLRQAQGLKSHLYVNLSNPNVLTSINTDSAEGIAAGKVHLIGLSEHSIDKPSIDDKSLLPVLLLHCEETYLATPASSKCHQTTCIQSPD